MTKRVLDVGQCQPDHASISQFLREHFDVEIVQTHGPDDTLDALNETDFDLVLINRKLDRDYSDGLEIIKQIKSGEAKPGVPVMLVTNYPEHQEEAVAVGAIPGFGKAQLNEPQTLERLRPVLA